MKLIHSNSKDKLMQLWCLEIPADVPEKSELQSIGITSQISEIYYHWLLKNGKKFSKTSPTEITFLGDFVKLRKASSRPSVRLSIRPSTRNNSAPTRCNFMKIYIWVFFENLSRRFKFHQNLTTITGTLHEERYIFLIISRSFLLRMRNVSDKFVEKN